MTDFETIIETLRKKARASWPGQTGEDRAARLEAFIRQRVGEYAAAFDLTKEDVLGALETRRDYSAVNYYQEATFPSLEDVRVFETRAALEQAMPSNRFRCPACKGVSTNPYVCTSGFQNEHGAVCDWKSYGLFRTLGKGLRLTVKETFLAYPIIDEIFMPLELETEAA